MYTHTYPSIYNQCLFIFALTFVLYYFLSIRFCNFESPRFISTFQAIFAHKATICAKPQQNEWEIKSAESKKKEKKTKKIALQKKKKNKTQRSARQIPILLRLHHQQIECGAFN